MTHCPCCGQTARVPDWDRAMQDLPPTPRRIAETVARRPGLSSYEIADAIYAQDINGGPADGAQVVRVLVAQHRQALARHGFALTGDRWGGYRVEKL